MGKTEEDVLGVRGPVRTPFHDWCDHAQSVNGNWLSVLRRYLVFVVFANFVWEVLQLPLYTIWHEAKAGTILFAVAHCTVGDILIATMALVTALALTGKSVWPHARYHQVATLSIVMGLGYTVFSEWLNTEVRESWTYTELMPVLPVLGTGISPLAQWIAIPLFAFWWARRPLFIQPQMEEEYSS